MTGWHDGHETLNRVVQLVAFFGVVVVLAVVLYTSLVVQGQRREQERQATALAQVPTPSMVPTKLVPTPAGTAYPGPYSMLPRPAGSSGIPRGGWWRYRTASDFDPARGVDLSGFFLGLVDWPFYGKEAVPRLAESWEVSGDGLVYTFHLRDDVYWVQCDARPDEVRRVRPVTAADVAFAIGRALQPQTKAPNAAALYEIAGARERNQGDDTAALGVEALDPTTVRFTLISPDGLFLLHLAQPVAWPVPPEPIAAYGDAWTEPGKIWVNGVFCPVRSGSGNPLALEINPWLPGDLGEVHITEYQGAPLAPLPTPTIFPYPTASPD